MLTKTITLAAMDFGKFAITLDKKQQTDENVIQHAINTCRDHLGGTIIIPAGTWRTKALHLTSNLHIKLEEGAILSFSDRPQDYLPVVFTRWEGMECFNYSPLIYAKECENIAITGPGVLQGNGQAWWPWKKLQQEAATELCYAESNGIPVEKRIYGTEKAALRPSFIQPLRCTNVILEDFTIINGPQWTIHPVYCENVLVSKVNVQTEGHNTDGLNPDSCKNVWIDDCQFETGDDCIALNSGMNEDGWRVNKPCENIQITNCKMLGGHGGVVIGSAMSGDVKNVFISNCIITGTDQGIRLKSMRGRGGKVSDVTIENIVLTDILQQAIQINMHYGSSTVPPKSLRAPLFENIKVSQVRGNSLGLAVEIKGLPEQKLKNITLAGVQLQAPAALVCYDAETIAFNDVHIKSPGTCQIQNVDSLTLSHSSIGEGGKK